MRVGELVIGEAPAALEHADAVALLGQAQRRDAAAETRADYQPVVVEIRHSSGLQHDHRDLALRLLLVLGELRRSLCLGVEETVALLALSLLRNHVDGLIADLNPRLRVRLEVVVPGRVLRRTGLGREDHVAAVIGHVHQRRHALFARPGSGVVNQDHRRALEHAAYPPVVLPEIH